VLQLTTDKVRLLKLPVERWDKLLVKHIRTALKAKGLPTRGVTRKAELIEILVSESDLNLDCTPRALQVAVLQRAFMCVLSGDAQRAFTLGHISEAYARTKMSAARTVRPRVPQSRSYEGRIIIQIHADTMLESGLLLHAGATELGASVGTLQM